MEPYDTCFERFGAHLQPRVEVVTLGVMAQDRAVAILKTRDMAETIRWYMAAGFVLREHFPGRDPTWCELARDDLVVQFLAGDTPWAGTPAMTGLLYVYPASVDAVHDELSGVINLEWGLEDRDWGDVNWCCGTRTATSSRSLRTPPTRRRRGEDRHGAHSHPAIANYVIVPTCHSVYTSRVSSSAQV
jgi:hypothetical protein